MERLFAVYFEGKRWDVQGRRCAYPTRKQAREAVESVAKDYVQYTLRIFESQPGYDVAFRKECARYRIVEYAPIRR
jgi:hypothetical protein